MKRSKFKEVVIEIIQSVSILLSNINAGANLNYLLSNPHMNELIIYYYNFTDEEIVDYYVAMLKSISLRIDIDNVSLFFNEV
jgi:protein CLEC16A